MLKAVSFILTVFILILASPFASADFYSEAEKIKEFNPDGQKYEFVRDYLTSLSYIYSNINQYDGLLSEGDFSERNKAGMLLAKLVQENANLRVAKNYVDKYLTGNNGLMMKAADIYLKICDDLIDLNHRERVLYEELLEAQNNEKDGFDNEKFLMKRMDLFEARKLSLKRLIETSYYAQKILVSDKPDRFGELVDLGVTNKQRQKLLLKIDELFPLVKEKEVKPGFSIIDTSILVVKERLLDDTWGDVR